MSVSGVSGKGRGWQVGLSEERAGSAGQPPPLVEQRIRLQGTAHTDHMWALHTSTHLCAAASTHSALLHMSHMRTIKHVHGGMNVSRPRAKQQMQPLVSRAFFALAVRQRSW